MWKRIGRESCKSFEACWHERVYTWLWRKKRVAIATVLAMEPKILVFDEPFANLDFQGKKMLRELIEKFRGEKTIVLSSTKLNILHFVIG